jgi:hypothetical protein
MSLLNVDDGLLSILLAMLRLLQQEKSMPEEDLLRFIAPDGLKTAEKFSRNTCRKWIKIGLLQSKKGKIDLHPELSRVDLSTPSGKSRLRSVIRDLIFHDAQNNDLLSKKAGNCGDFTVGIGYMLMLDCYRVSQLSHGKYERIMLEQFNPVEGKAIDNDTRWKSFQQWASFLGFGWNGAKPGTWNPDPAIAINDRLSAIFASEKEMPQELFFKRLGEALPVIDGGKYRVEIEKQLTPHKDGWTKFRGDEISSSLSRALLRLENNRAIRLEVKADAPPRVLLGRNGMEVRRVTHISYKGRGHE